MDTIHPPPPDDSADAQSRLHFVWLFSVTAVAYLLGAELGHWLTAESGSFATFWPNSGLLLALLLRTPLRRWGIIVAATATANLSSDLLIHDQKLLVSLGFTVANMVEGIIGALLIRRALGERIRLVELRSVLIIFILATAVSTVLGSLIGATIASQAFGVRLLLAWPVWWVADALGVLITLPLVFSLYELKTRPRMATLVELMALLVGLVAVGTYIFTSAPYIAPIVLLLFLLWGAIRLEVSGVALAAFVLAVLAVRYTVLGYGIFAQTGNPSQRIVSVQLFVGISSFIFYAFAVVLAERRRTEESLEERVRERTASLVAQRELLSVTLTSIGDAVVTTDTEGRVVQLNPVAETLTGWTTADAVGLPLEAVFRIVNEVTRQPVENPAIQALSRGVIVGLANHTILISKDGTERPIEDSAAPIRSKDGQVVGCILVFRDVSQRRSMEEDRERVAAILNSLVASAPVGIVLFDSQMRYQHVNGPLAEMNGLPVEAHLGKTVLEIVPHLSRQAEALFRKVLDEGVTIHDMLVEGETLKAPGIQRAWRGSWFPVAGRDGKPVGVGAIIQEVTEQRRLERERENGQRTLATLVERCPFGIYIVDDEFRVAMVNVGSQEKAFVNVRPLVGRPFDEVMRILWPEPTATECINIFRHTLATGESYYSKNFVSPRADIDQVEGYEWELHRITLPSGRDGVVCYYFDATLLRQAEAALREADRKKDEFLATLAHELRNPLAPLRNGLQLMKLGTSGSQGEEPTSRTQALNMMERQLEQMVHLIDDLMDMSRISQGKIELRKQRVELAKIVQQAVETSRPLIDEREHDFALEVPEESILVDADVTRLNQVFSNLLNNAAKYTERGGRIRLRVSRSEGNAVVTVSDNGVGIPSAMLPKVFDIFTQVDRSLERSQGGLGIGLSLVKKLVEMHGGIVEAKSEGQGGGSEFVVTLPIVNAHVEPSPPLGDEATQSISGRRRILVADDNSDAAMSLAMLLRLMGHDAHIAKDGQEAIESASKLKPDVVLLDIGMPRLNGLDACRRIRDQEWGRNMVLVALTGWGQEEDRRQTEEAGFNYHLVKPIDPKALQEFLSGVVKTQ